VWVQAGWALQKGRTADAAGLDVAHGRVSIGFPIELRIGGDVSSGFLLLALRDG
jgi:hypothetical protein